MSVDCRRLRVLRDRQGGVHRAADGDHDGASSRVTATCPIDVGLWRTLNVLIGIVIALAFSFVLPQYATYSWRYRLADNLRECARIYALIARRRADDPRNALTKRFLAMSRRLVQSRSLMASVAKEIDVPVSMLDEIQRLHRSILTALEMMATGRAATTRADARRAAASAEERAVRHTLLLIARALRFGRVGFAARATGSPAAAARLERAVSAAAELAARLAGAVLARAAAGGAGGPAARCG